MALLRIPIKSCTPALTPGLLCWVSNLCGCWLMLQNISEAYWKLSPCKSMRERTFFFFLSPPQELRTWTKPAANSRTLTWLWKSQLMRPPGRLALTRYRAMPLASRCGTSSYKIWKCSGTGTVAKASWHAITHQALTQSRHAAVQTETEYSKYSGFFEAP